MSGVVGDVNQTTVLHTIVQLKKEADPQESVRNVVKAHSVLLEFVRTVGKEMS
jgi:hypothetical protein